MLYETLTDFFRFFLGLQVFAQPVTDSVLVEGIHRTFHFNKLKISKKEISLVFVLHGSGGTGIQEMENAGKIEAISEREGLMIAYPDGHNKLECVMTLRIEQFFENVLMC